MPEKQQVGGLTEKWALSLVQVLGPNSGEYVLYLSYTHGLFHCSGSLVLVLKGNSRTKTEFWLGNCNLHVECALTCQRPQVWFPSLQIKGRACIRPRKVSLLKMVVWCLACYQCTCFQAEFIYWTHQVPEIELRLSIPDIPYISIGQPKNKVWCWACKHRSCPAGVVRGGGVAGPKRGEYIG